MTTTREPSGMSLATCSAAHTAEPLEPPHEQALLTDELARDAEGVAVVRLDPAVDQLAVEDVGDEVVADALDLVALDLAGAGQDRALRVDADDLAARQLALERRGPRP